MYFFCNTLFKIIHCLLIESWMWLAILFTIITFYLELRVKNIKSIIYVIQIQFYPGYKIMFKFTRMAEFEFDFTDSKLAVKLLFILKMFILCRADKIMFKVSRSSIRIMLFSIVLMLLRLVLNTILSTWMGRRFYCLDNLYRVKDYWIRTRKCSIFVRIKTHIAIYGNTSLNTDEYGELFSPYSVVFHEVLIQRRTTYSQRRSPKIELSYSYQTLIF